MLLQDRMNRLFEDATQKRARDESEHGDDLHRADWSPLADVYENEADYTIALDLPGIERKALEINIEDDRLLIRGTRQLESVKGMRSERPRGTFLRTFGVPRSVDQSRISADYKDGVLEIRLPKQTEPKGQRIEIKVA
jgi:HSP20 family protein